MGRWSNALAVASGMPFALAMSVGRGAAARAVADLAALTAGERVVDVGCGPGATAREAARRGARVTGVDPSPAMRAMAGWISAVRRVRGVAFVDGRAEALPLADATADVVWSLSAVHHWSDRPAALREIRRVLAPGGRVLLCEALVGAGAHGLAAHGMRERDAEALLAELAAAGFADAHLQRRRPGRRALAIATATRPALPPPGASGDA